MLRPVVSVARRARGTLLEGRTIMKNLSRRDFGKVLAIAVGGVLASTTLACKSGSGSGPTEKHACKGLNTCKGQGGCSTGDNGCSGKNSCAKKGGCATVE